MKDSIITPTCECGMYYVVGHEGDEAAHLKFHEEYSRGPHVPEVEVLATIAAKGSLRLVVVNNSISCEIRQAVAQVVFVAQRCMDYPFGYCGVSEPDDRYLYALTDGTQIVGMVITSYDDYFRKLIWNSDGRYQNIDSEIASHTRPKITRVWLAANYRHLGLAQWLIKEVATDLDCGISSFGWEMPFTESGEKLVKLLCPTGFFGCGDIHPSK